VPPLALPKTATKTHRRKCRAHKKSSKRRPKRCRR
jgi:hypothetical protein